MKSDRQFCFSLDGEDVYLYTLINNRGTEVRITNYGAILMAFRIAGNEGSFNDIVLGFDKPEDYLSEAYLQNYPWMGCAVGRTANRIKAGKAAIGDHSLQLALNRAPDHLHGGFSGFDKKVWKQVSLTNNPAALELSYTSADGEEGYHGNLAVTIRFELNNDDEFSYEFRATTDKPTLVNLTHHSYFNLDNGQGTIDDQEVKIYASQVLGQDEGLVANGHLLPVAGTVFDFREFRAIGKRVEEKEIYDQSFVVDFKSQELRLVAEARSPRSATLLKIYSTEPVVHFYSGRWIPGVAGKNHTLYGQCSGFCLETHIHPNAVNIDSFPNTVLRPGEKYYHKTIYVPGRLS